MEMVMSNGFAELSANEIDAINGGSGWDVAKAFTGSVLIATAPVAGLLVGTSTAPVAGPVAGWTVYWGMNAAGTKLLMSL